MSKTLIKTAAAVFAAAFAATGAALADQAPASADGAVLGNIYTEITANQERTRDAITASAEQRIAERASSSDDHAFTKHSRAFAVASN